MGLHRWIVLLAFLSVAPMGVADIIPCVPSTIKLTDGLGSDFGYGHGGIFQVRSISGVFLFNTFCVERNEYISFNTPYQASLGKAAIGGGVAGQEPGTGADLLSSQTAKLYGDYRKGLIAINTLGEANAFQAAIWRFEGELTQSQFEGIANNPLNFDRAKANEYYNYAKNYIDGNIGTVRIMHLTTATGGKVQDQLAVPEVGTMILLGLSFAGVIPGARKLRKNKA